MKVFRVAEYGPAAWLWAPESLKVVCEKKVRGCDCHGTGTLGTVIKDGGSGVEVTHAIPCLCLRAIIDETNEAAVEDELNQHYMQVKTEGIICSCLFCQLRRKVVEEKALTVSD